MIHLYCMKNLCPDIFRQRLVVEGKYGAELSESKIKTFLVALSRELKMKIIYGPVIKDIAGSVNPKHSGFECILIWAESGASLYVWDKFKFFTLDIYTCKKFSAKKAVSFAKQFFSAKEITHKSV